MKQIPVAMSGWSLITPLDREGVGTWEAMCAGRRVEREAWVAEELLEPDVELDRSIRLALAAARRVPGPFGDTALFCGSSKGPIGTCLAAYERVRRGEEMGAMEARQVVLGVGAMGTILRERLGVGGAAHMSVAACSSGMHALHRAAAAVRRGECRRALVVAADASLHPLFEGSFARLGVLAPADENGVRRCEPFGREGRGFFVSEAGAAVVLEEAGEGVWLEESWIGGDGSGLIAVDRRTEGLRAGLRVCLGDERPAFVHAHATGTEHDGYELEAVRAVVGMDVPVFSHKGWLGHSLGAAGLVSVVISAECHGRGVTVSGEAVGTGRASLTIAQGFGGHIGVVRLRAQGVRMVGGHGADGLTY